MINQLNLQPVYNLIDNYIIKGKYSLARDNLEQFRNLIPEDKVKFYDSMLEIKLEKEAA